MPEKKALSFSTLVIIILCISFCLLTIFSITTIININRVRSEIAAEEQLYLENQDRLAQLRQLSKREDEFRTYLALIDKLIPDGTEEARIIKQVQNLANGSSVDFIEIQFETRVVNNNMNTMPMTLSFSGGYPGLVELINRLSNGERLIRIDEINITNGTESAFFIDAIIKARAFFR